MFSENEAQNAAKKKQEFEIANEISARVGAEAAKLGEGGKNKQSGGGGDFSNESIYRKKSSLSASRRSREARERESSPTEPVKSKNQSINFTDLPKP